jgi:hypothetical protein
VLVCRVQTRAGGPKVHVRWTRGCWKVACGKVRTGEADLTTFSLSFLPLAGISYYEVIKTNADAGAGTKDGQLRASEGSWLKLCYVCDDGQGQGQEQEEGEAQVAVGDEEAS